jgi:hypothetical protein
LVAAFARLDSAAVMIFFSSFLDATMTNVDTKNKVTIKFIKKIKAIQITAIQQRYYYLCDLGVQK